jgi:putative spermidine/putrescine transport system substrate-binding protein
MRSKGFVPARSMTSTCHRGPLRAVVPAVVALALLLAACGGDSSSLSRTDAAVPRGWHGVLDQARAQTVRFWMYGGDERVNAYVDDEIRPPLERLGVRLQRVPVSDTADAVRRVVAERRAGRTAGGGVDLLWINGENFASGKQAGLWLRDWSRALPNSRRFVDWDDPSMARDFGVAVDGQESPWQRAAFVYAHDRSRVKQPPRSFDALLAYAKAHPGRVTYPAPPDFTGSAFVRQVVADKGEDGAFAYLRELNPYLYRAGEVFPKSRLSSSSCSATGWWTSPWPTTRTSSTPRSTKGGSHRPRDRSSSGVAR